MIQVNRPSWFGHESAGALPRCVAHGCRPAAGVPRGRCQTLTITRTDSGNGVGCRGHAAVADALELQVHDFIAHAQPADVEPLLGRQSREQGSLIVILPAAIPGKYESSRRRQATERHATAKCDAAPEVPDLR